MAAKPSAGHEPKPVVLWSEDLQGAIRLVQQKDLPLGVAPRVFHTNL